jgi:uncharacterized RDD family membrane protein YckC
MKKITEIETTLFRTTHHRDSRGNLIKGRQEYVAKRPVKSADTGLRVANIVVDYMFFLIIIYFVDYLYDLVLIYMKPENPISLTFLLFGKITKLLIYPALYIFFEYKWQKSPGKFLTKTIVIDEYSNKPTLRQIVLRSIIRTIPFDPLSFLGDRSRGWHDKWSDTFVVTQKELEVLRSLLSEEQVENVTKIE